MKLFLALAAALALSGAPALAKGGAPDNARQKAAAPKAKPASAPTPAPAPAGPVGSCGGKTPKKDVREALKSEEIDAKTKDAEGTVKTACGCAIKIVVEGCTYPDGDNVIRLKDALAAVAEAAKGYCNDAPSKKEWCGAVADAHVAWLKANPVPEPVRKGKSLLLNSNDFSYSDADHIKKLID